MLYFLKFPLVDTLAGAELHTLKLAQHFHKAGHKIKLLTSDHKLFRLFEQHHLPRRRMFIGWEPTAKWSLLLWPVIWVMASRKLKKIINNAPPDSIFFCQSLTEKLILPSLLPSPGDGEGLGERSKIIFLEHKIPGQWLKLNPLKFLYLRRAKQAQIITVSNFAKQAFIKLGIPESNIQVIYPGITPSVIARRGAPRQSQFTIGILSRLDPEKGILEFLNSVIPGQDLWNPSWRILIAGEGKQKSEIEKLAQKIHQIKLLGFVHDLDKFFSQISVLVYPSLVPESFGLAALEAQTRGIPVVASNIGALPEIVKHSETGFLISCPPQAWGGWPEAGRDRSEWIEYLESLQNPELYKKVSAAALAHAQNFSESKMFEQFDKLLPG